MGIAALTRLPCMQTIRAKYLTSESAFFAYLSTSAIRLSHPPQVRASLT